METNEIVKTAVAQLTHVGLMVLGAIVLLIVGRWLIAFAVRHISRAFERQKVDPTLLRYVGNIVSVLLNVALIVAILGYFGVETTTFAALLAAAGVAAGADGVLVEVHNDPDSALSDGAQSLTIPGFTDMMSRVKAVADAVGRFIR